MTQISNGESGSSVRTKLNASLAKTDQMNVQGSNITAASSIDIGASAGETVNVTGNTGITALGTVAAGTLRWVKFTGTPQITHNATSLILPSGANITAAANDTALFRSLGSGNWECLVYIRNSGKALIAPSYSDITSKPTTISGWGITDWHGAAANVASATTTDLSAQTSNYINITGTTTITGFGTVASGKIFLLKFAAALTLTYNATSMILPTGGDIVTEAGDMLLMVSEGSGNWRIISYFRASGLSLRKLTSVSGTYSVLDTDDVISCNGTFTVTLPTAVGRTGKHFTFKNIGTGIVTIATTSSQTIDAGATTAIMNTQNNSLTLISDGSNWITVHLPSVNIQTFTSSGTWTKPAGAKYCRVIALGAGGGGGAGRRGAAGTLRTGGGGGGSGQVVIVDLLASALGATETVTVGAGGPGAAAITADSTNGGTGTTGGNTSIGTVVIARGGTGGGGGNAAGAGTAGPQVGASSQWSIQGSAGGQSSATGGNGSGGGGQTVNPAPTGGGGGGGISTGDSAGTGATGGNISISNFFAGAFSSVNGGAANTAGGATAALIMYNGLTIGSGGGGGNASIVAAASAGGNGGGPGAGGGGGGASLNGNNSGAGGNGQDGWLIVITYL